MGMALWNKENVERKRRRREKRPIKNYKLNAKKWEVRKREKKAYKHHYKYENISRSAPIKIGEPKDLKYENCTLNKNLIWNLVINTREIAVNSVVHWSRTLVEKYA